MKRPVDYILELSKEDANVDSIVLELWENDVDDFWVGLDWSLSQVIDPKLKSVPKVADDDDEDFTSSFTFNHFNNLMVSLVDDNLSEKDKKGRVSAAAMVADVTEWNNWYRPILMKTLHKNIPIIEIKKAIQQLTTRM